MKVIITSHGLLANSLKEYAEMVYGQKQDSWFTVCLEDNIKEFKERWKELIRKLQSEKVKNLLVLCDIVRGSPFNVALELGVSKEFKNINFHLVTGLSTILILQIADNMSFLQQTKNLQKILQDIVSDSAYLMKYVNPRQILESQENCKKNEDSL